MYGKNLKAIYYSAKTYCIYFVKFDYPQNEAINEHASITHKLRKKLSYKSWFSKHKFKPITLIHFEQMALLIILTTVAYIMGV